MEYGVGVIGAGTVGGGVIEILTANRDVISDKTGASVTLRHVAELKDELLAGLDLSGVTVSKDASALIADPQVHVVCELIGGLEPARRFILEALRAGKHVVTANKMLLATHGPELVEAAVQHGVELRFEAAVAGAVPIIKALRESLAANRIEGIYGILNGTCNYILSRMTYEGLEFEETLNQAIANGFAETPPDLDILGHDTAHKCQILASLAYSTRIDLNAIPVEGITSITHLDVAYAREMGYIIKLLAIIREVDGSIEARVHPALIPESHLLAAVRNEFNGIYVKSDCADATLYYGRGAGRKPTASAVVGDIVDIARNKGCAPFKPFTYSRNLAIRDIGLAEGCYYLRLTTEDHPGVLGRVCSTLGKHGVSIASCIQKNQGDQEPVHVVLMTHATVESAIKAALSEIDGFDCIAEPTQFLRVF
ncbi:MAG TPA: homoserine dehydrogenase [Candidatus Hydrogenedentes bacterium]|jgi:homoserine dehydrogenase|nr:MAG: Homoserine dehydrogenase [Candidatus Hydrogenedentes bacterium ADurb.Bin170]HOD95051.1 homoserine dehydrogenase [Candidatus Hydrogenedentota bacterium]HOM48745.1 homoserine dehydrogenase [Candidatus Hydrogenedentota bacterium]HOR50447.1 homoserine dehydrogenase [Candidatus Hydrogenedentota bacterium]HPK24425.1 homoserine dehydrogenase [Candidatus Hydrogenedentota bacterium]